MIRRVGIYPGTFDPVHAGHVAFAEAAIRECALDEVVFLPERSPRGKQNVTDISHRMALLDCAVGAMPRMRAVDLKKGQFTVSDTLPELKRMFAGAELVMLVGSDVARTFLHRWPGLDKLLASVSLAIGLREGDGETELTNIMRSLEETHKLQVQYRLINAPHAAGTSSAIRHNVDSSEIMHPSVVAYIRQHGLYEAGV